MPDMSPMTEGYESRRNRLPPMSTRRSHRAMGDHTMSRVGATAIALVATAGYFIELVNLCADLGGHE